MNPYPVLSGLRVGCVRYLNSKPLIHGLPGVHLAHPAELVRSLREGALDVALVPVFEVLRAPEAYRVVEGIAIASDGPVYSVFVAHRLPLERLRGVLADPASLTSVHLFQLLSRFFLRRELPLCTGTELFPEGTPSPPEGGDPALGQLWIGNQAIQCRLDHGEENGLHYWDLGEAWRAWTGLPFVYAAWVLRRDLKRELAGAVAAELRCVAQAGVAAVEEIVAGELPGWRGMARRYLTEHIRFDLGPREHEGLLRFSGELERAGFVRTGRDPIDFL